MEFFSFTDKGLVRNQNEDVVYAGGSDPVIAVVADGMGGHNAGNVAASEAVAIFTRLTNGAEKITKQTVEHAFRRANDHVFRMSLLNDDYAKMGTTMTAAIIKNSSAIIGHVGDSRAYLFRKEIYALTKDHSFVNELIEKGMIDREAAKNHPHRNVITRAIGTHMKVDVDVFEVDIMPGDILLLCSDGLTFYLTPNEISGILALNISIEQKIKQLVNMALKHGGADNISAIGVLIG